MTVAHQQYIANAKVQVQKLWDAIHELQDMQTQWNANDYGNTLPDGVDVNEGVTKVQVGACVFDSANALMAVLAGGNGGNLAKLL